MADPQLDRLEEERRRFIRANHPDRGGDPAEFTAGLVHFDERRERLLYPAKVTAVPTRRGRQRLTAFLTNLLLRQPKPPRVR